MDDRTETFSFGLVGDHDRDIGLSRRPVVGVRGLSQSFKIYIANQIILRRFCLSQIRTIEFWRKNAFFGVNCSTQFMLLGNKCNLPRAYEANKMNHKIIIKNITQALSISEANNGSYFFLNAGLVGVRAESIDIHRGFGDMDRPPTIGLSFGFTGDRDRAIGLSRRPVAGLPRGLTQSFKIHLYIYQPRAYF